MGESGTIQFSGEARWDAACAVAGALAEAGIASLEVSDPRACRTWTLRAREADLPRTLMEAAPGTTLSGEGVALLVDEHLIRWVAEGTAASMLQALTAQ